MCDCTLIQPAAWVLHVTGVVLTLGLPELNLPCCLVLWHILYGV